MQGGVRKRGTTWSYYFDLGKIDGKRKKKEKGGFRTKKEAEQALTAAMNEYNNSGTVFEPTEITVADYLNQWFDLYCKTNLKYNTQVGYLRIIQGHLIPKFGVYRLKAITPAILQEYAVELKMNGNSKSYLVGILSVFSAALNYAVEPMHYLPSNPMQYVKLRGRKQETDIFLNSEEDTYSIPTITHEQFQKLEEFLKTKDNPALLPVQIAYYTGLRIGEVCGLTWQDINLEEQYLTVRRSMRYNGTRHTTEVGTTKRSKVRTVDFCDTLAAILRAARTEQRKNRFRYGELYHLNYYKEVKEKGRTYYEVYSRQRTEEVPEDYKEISFVCLRADGAYEAPSTVGIMCRAAKKKVKGLEDFHFHTLRHTYTSNLLSGGAKPKDVQELLGHSDVSTTMNIYAHSTREAKRTSARLLDKVVGGE